MDQPIRIVIPESLKEVTAIVKAAGDRSRIKFLLDIDRVQETTSREGLDSARLCGTIRFL